MTIGQCRDTIKNTLGNMTPLEPSSPTSTSLGYSNTAGAEKHYLKSNTMKMIEIITEEMNNSL